MTAAKLRRSRTASPKRPPRRTFVDVLRQITPSRKAAAELQRALAPLQKRARKADENCEAALKELFVTLERTAVSGAPRADIQRSIRQTSRSVRDLMSSRENAIFVIGRVIGRTER